MDVEANRWREVEAMEQTAEHYAADSERYERITVRGFVIDVRGIAPVLTRHGVYIGTYGSWHGALAAAEQVQ